MLLSISDVQEVEPNIVSFISSFAQLVEDGTLDAEVANLTNVSSLDSPNLFTDRIESLQDDLVALRNPLDVEGNDLENIGSAEAESAVQTAAESLFNRALQMIEVVSSEQQGGKG